MSSELECDNCDIDVFRGGKEALGRVLEVQRSGAKMRVLVEVPTSVEVRSARWRVHFVDDRLEPISVQYKIDDGGRGGFAFVIDEACELPSLRVFAREMPPPRPPRVTYNPPRPFEAKVLRVEVQGSATFVTFDVGSDRGVTRQTTARVTRDVECKIIRVEKVETVCRLVANGVAPTTIHVSP